MTFAMEQVDRMPSAIIHDYILVNAPYLGFRTEDSMVQHQSCLVAVSLQPDSNHGHGSRSTQISISMSLSHLVEPKLHETTLSKHGTSARLRALCALVDTDIGRLALYLRDLTLLFESDVHRISEAKHAFSRCRSLNTLRSYIRSGSNILQTATTLTCGIY